MHIYDFPVKPNNTFPRSIERGPVEALPLLILGGSLSKPFPRSIERGPVEAIGCYHRSDVSHFLSALD